MFKVSFVGIFFPCSSVFIDINDFEDVSAGWVGSFLNDNYTYLAW